MTKTCVPFILHPHFSILSSVSSIFTPPSSFLAPTTPSPSSPPRPAANVLPRLIPPKPQAPLSLDLAG